MNCKYCGAITYPTDRFCSVCGKPIPPVNTVTSSTQYSNINQIDTNNRQNINTFDSYNYNPSRYNPANQTNQVKQSNQVLFANSIALSLLAIMSFIFVLIAIIYYSSGVKVETASVTTNPSPSVSVPSVQNTTSTSRTAVNSTQNSIMTEDFSYKIIYTVPSTLKEFKFTPYEKYYEKTSNGALIDISTYMISSTEMLEVIKEQDVIVDSQTTIKVSNYDYTCIKTHSASSNNLGLDFYFYEFKPNYVLMLSVSQNGLTNNELKTLLNVSIE